MRQLYFAIQEDDMEKEAVLEIRDQVAFAHIMSAPPEQQAHFWELIESGSTPRFACMIATKTAPGIKAPDHLFNENARHRMNTMNSEQRDSIVEIAQKAGINTQGKYYVPGLGRYNDPKAWCSTADDALAVAKERGLILSGAVNYDPDNEAIDRQVEAASKRPKLAPDIARELTEEYMTKDPHIKEKAMKNPERVYEETYDMVQEKHGKAKS